MLCPYCQTENRDDRESCYYCEKDLSMLRLIVNKAKHHYNQALEFAERGHTDQAIVELKNAIDLDGSLVHAHVVLGTLYAKKEMFAEARESWRHALALGHHFEKAHDYLNKAGQAEYVFPIMHRLKRTGKILAASTAVLLLLALILLVALVRPEPGMAEVRDAAALMRSPEPLKLREADRLLAKTLERKKIGTQAEDLATNLRAQVKQRLAALESDWQRRLDLASKALNNHNDPYTAWQIARSVEEENPSPEVKKSIERVYTRTTQTMSDIVHQSAEQFKAGELPYQHFQNDAKQFLAQIKSGPQHDQVTALVSEVEAIHQQRIFGQATAAVTQAPTAEVYKLVTDWTARAPELDKPLCEIVDRRLATESAAIEARLNENLAQARFDQALHEVEQLSLLYTVVHRPRPEARLAELRDSVARARQQHERNQAEARRQTALTQARQAFAQKQWESFLALTAQPESLTADELERAKLAGMRQEALQAFALEMLGWMKQRGEQFGAARLSAEDAHRTVTTYEAVMQGLPKDQLAAAAPRVLYSAAAAYEKLGQPARALDLLKRLRQEYPKSPALKDADKLQKRIEPPQKQDQAPKPAEKQQPKEEKKPAPKTQARQVG